MTESNQRIDRPMFWTVIFFICVAALLLSAVLVGWALLAYYDNPNPVRLLRSNYQVITDYVGRVEKDEVPYREDKEGYYLLDTLYKGGAIFVRKEQGCIIITFQSLPPEGTEELVYCSKGLRLQLQKIQHGKRIAKLKSIDDHWVYWLRE